MEQLIQTKLTEKGLAPSSIVLYIRNLRKLNDNEPIKNFKFLTNINNIVEKIKHLKPNTRKAYLITIVSVLNCFLEQKAIKTLCDKYYLLMKFEKDNITKTPTETMTDTQKKNWISWETVNKVWDTLNEKVESFYKKKTITETQYNILLSYIILSLYVKIPTRRNKDFSFMNIKYDVMPTDNKEINYLDYTKKQFIYNTYKTQYKYHEQKYDIPPELLECINKYLKHHPILKGKINKKTNIRFLMYYDGSSLDAVNSITRILNKLFGLKVGSSMLRHIYLTDKFGDENKERETIAEQMGHNLMSQQQYIKDDEKIKNKDIVINFD